MAQVQATVTAEIDGLYVALYGVAPTQAGITYWENLANAFDPSVTITNASTTAISVADETFLGQQFVMQESTYFNTLYGSLTDLQFIQALYQNITNSAGSLAGVQYWLSLLQTAETAGQSATNARAGLAGQFVHDTLSDDLTVGAAALGLSAAQYAALVEGQQSAFNKNAIAQDWATESNMPGGNILNYTTTSGLIFDAAVNIISFISANSLVLNAAESSIAGAVLAGSLTPVTILVGSSTQTTQALTTSTDSVTAANVAITGVIDVLDGKEVASATTAQVADKINPTGTYNTFTLTAMGSPIALSSSNLPVLNNVQVLNVSPSSFGWTLDPTGLGTALTTLGMVGGSAGSNVTFVNVPGNTITNFVMFNVSAGGNPLMNISTLTSFNLQANVTLNQVDSPTDTTVGNGQNDPILQFQSQSGGGPAFETVNINSIGPVPNFLSYLYGVESLTISGGAPLTIDAPVAFFNGANVVAPFDAGGIWINLTGNDTQSVQFAGGAGPDTIVLDAAQLKLSNDFLKGGSGLDNTIAVTESTLNSSTNAQELATLAAAQEFQTLQMAGASATVDVSKIPAAFTDIDFATHGAVKVTNNTNTEHLSDLTQFALGTVNISEAPGNSILNYDLTTETSGASDSGMTLSGIKVINLTSNGLYGHVFGNSGISGAVDNLVINITGNGQLQLGKFAVTSIGEQINAASFSGGLFYTTDGFGDAINSGTGGDVLTLSTPVLHAGSYLGDAVSLISANDQIILQPSAAGDANAAGFETVAGFKAGHNAYYMSSPGPSFPAAAYFDATAFNLSAQPTLAAAATTAADTAFALGDIKAITKHDVFAFSYQGSSYLFIEQNGTGTYTPGVDVIIKEIGLVGTHTASDFFLS